ncbi:hypothetical protein PghCCS26_08400 [Paenibacillus glycanilyticus]|uniref:Uncharacterized protein n=1 Tax=Paenibacillus glycanilyticus TaxID=126569 RepID=A0ABQ6NG46_9BACL|nr:hypothetical protein [Paenibacillus glycanilyticus]GMK43713.1 hypothetical protein PghCCS26_08400 [Paenibacillus glycanilyticus]
MRFMRLGKIVLVSGGLLAAMLIGFIVLRFGSALSQEGNPAPILSAIAKLEYSDESHMRFDATDKGSRYVSANSGQDRYEPVKAYMKQYGWSFKEQMGSGLMFERNGQSSVIETRLYSKHYYLWDIPNEVIS